MLIPATDECEHGLPYDEPCLDCLDEVVRRLANDVAWLRKRVEELEGEEL